MRCDEYRADFLAGVPSEESARHVASCSSCRRAVAVLGPARDELVDPSLWEEPPPGLEDLVVSLVSGSATTSPISEPKTHPAAARKRWVLSGAAAIAASVIAFGAWAATRPAAAHWELEMHGTGGAPQATATVKGWNTPSGTRVVLDIRDLAPAPEGFVYELWFSHDEYYVSAGSFSAPSEVELGVGIARSDFPRLWVTLEPLDDDGSPSGETVLDSGA